MALKIDLCKISRVREIPWADGVTKVREGQSLKRVYEGGKEHIKPSDAADDADGFAGVSLSTETTLEGWPVKEDLVLAADGNTESASLSHRPRDRSNRLAIFNSSGAAVDVSTDGSPASGEIDVTAAGVIETNSDVAAGTYTFVYEYAPSAAEARILQGDTEPGPHVSAELSSNSVVVEGDIYTTEWDVEADWDDTNAAHGVRMTTDGRFTIATSSDAIPGVAVIEYPTVDQEFLGLRFAL